MQWIWDEEKSRSNKRKHGLSFEAAQYVFSDPLAISRMDSFPEEERWQTIERSPHFVNGLIGQLTIFDDSLSETLRERACRSFYSGMWAK